MSSSVIGALRINLSADSAEFARDMKQAQGSVGQFAKFARTALSAAPLAAVAAAAGKAVQAFARFETQQLTTQAVLVATGNASGRTAEQIEALAREIGFNTLASTQGVREAANQLLTFRAVAGETFDQTLRAAQDLAQLGFGSIESNAVRLGQALEDPIQGIGRLRRVGVSFTAQQRDMIQSFVDAGRAADAQRLILEAVEQQVGGAGVAAGGGLAGAFDGLNEEIGVFVERTGESVAELFRLQDAIAGVTSLIRTRNILDGGGRPAADLRADLVREQIAGLREEIGLLERTAPFDTAIGRMREQITGLEAQAAAYEEASRMLRRGEQEQTVVNGARAATAAAEEQRQKILDVMSALDDEAAAAGRSAAENRALLLIRQAGVATDSAEAQAIRERVAAVEAASTRTTAAAGSARTALSDMAREAQSVFEATRTPAENLQAEFQRLNEMVRSGAIDWDTYSRAVRQAQDAFDATKSTGGELASTLSGELSNMFQGLITGAQSAREALGQLLQSLGRMLINRAFQAIVGGAFGGGGGASGIGGFLAGLFGGARAEGGPVSPGKAYLVGERGPELIMPRAAGMVVPNDQLQGGMGGGPIPIEIRVSPTGEFDARVAAVADQRASVVVKANNRQIPGLVADTQKRRG